MRCRPFRSAAASPRRKSTQVAILAVAASLLGLSWGAQAYTFTLSCAATGSSDGAVQIYLTNAAFESEQSVSISANTPASEKCAAIAHAFPLNATLGPGNAVTFDADQVTIISDNTGENLTSLSVGFSPPGQLVSLIEIPTPNGSAIPPPGTTFAGALSAPSFSPFTFGASGDGTKTAATLLSEMNSDITASTGNATLPGLSCSIPITIPTGPSSSVVGCRSAPFDPTAVEISWDENTASNLVNFGLLVVPEPSSVVLSVTGLIALCRWHDRGQRRATGTA